MFLNQITKTINTSESNYNEIRINENIENVNVYLNGVLQIKDEHFLLNNNKITFDENILKDDDLIIIDYIGQNESNVKIDEDTIKYIYHYNNSNEFLIEPIDKDSLINIYLNGVLLVEDYEFIIEGMYVKKIKISLELKENDNIIIECFKRM